MKQPTPKPGYACTYHHDGTVSYWNVWFQQWERMDARDFSDDLLKTLNDEERDRIRRICNQERHRHPHGR